MSGWVWVGRCEMDGLGRTDGRTMADGWMDVS